MKTKPKALIVEDDEMSRIAVHATIKDLFECDCAPHGREAFRKVDLQVYDLILMDINFGNDRLNGEVLMKIIKANPKNYHTKIIAITSNLKDIDIERFLRSGFDNYCLKPVIREILISTIEGVFKKVSKDVFNK